MKKFFGLLIAILLSTFIANAQPQKNRSEDGIAVTVATDSLNTISVQFSDIKLNQDDIREQMQELLNQSSVTSDALANSINRFTDVVGQGILLNQQTRLDIIAEEFGSTPDELKQSFKKNTVITLIAIVPAILYFLWACVVFNQEKGIDWTKALGGLAVAISMAVSAGFALYYLLTVFINSKYLIIKDLSEALFK